MGAQLRVVRRRIRSVQSTMKITRAMELIASSRILKAQARVEAARPYALQLSAAMQDLAAHAGSISHPLLDAREQPAKAGVLVVTSDHGNADQLKSADGSVLTAHSLNPVPVLFVGRAVQGRPLHDGVLADVAPTILELAGLPRWPEMTGRSLLEGGPA